MCAQKFCGISKKTMLKDETGNRYGRLTVIRRADPKDERRTDKVVMASWVCKCDCGGTKIARGNDLRSGATRSCGCLKRENMQKMFKARRHGPYDHTGERFGRLTVLRIGTRSTSGRRWVCRCDCGNIVEVRGAALRKGKTQSCGCLRVEKVKERAWAKVLPLEGKA